MIFITEKSIKPNLKKFGFSSYDAEVLVTLNDALLKFAKNRMGQVLKKHNIDVIEVQHVVAQKGGRTVLPSEYFGIESGSYFDSLKHNGTDMSVTNAMIRPTILTNDLSGVITGGAARRFVVSKSVFTNVLNEAKVALSKEVAIKSKAALQLKEEAENKLSEVLDKACSKAKKTSHLSHDLLNKVLAQKKYDNLRV